MHNSVHQTARCRNCRPTVERPTAEVSLPVAYKARPWRIAEAILTLGLSELIEHLKLDPRWRYALLAIVLLNEIRGIAVVYQVGAWAVGTAT
jgi:hypothetical protein